uniref:Putative spermine/spermidine synthase n=1 Tax=Ornithodoros turicata TaxID=34597 RepID=A0A2R5LH54_9ACAR
MSLLPKTSSEFATEKYWNEFFEKRGKKSFEWYGEYWQLCGILHKYIKTPDKLLVVGCGNSTLSADLYDSGYKSNVSIDISEVAIKKMNEKYNKTRPQMTFQQMDASKMDFADEEFSAVVDKGTVDALATDKEPLTVSKLSAIFAEIRRVLKVCGRFICVSLLQQHVMELLVGWFYNDTSCTWVIRVHRCEDAEQTSRTGSVVLPVFVIVFTKMKKMPSMNSVLELAIPSDSKPVRTHDLRTLYTEVSSQQQYAFMRHWLASRKIQTCDNISLDLFSPTSDVPRYQLYVCDRPVASAPLKFAIFVVPQGRETEWLFSSPEGRLQLAESCSAERLVVVHLSRNHVYNSLEEVKGELSQKVMELAPSSCTEGKQVPFLSTGEDVGHREVRHRGSSELTGDYVVEDVTLGSGTVVRRLIFLNKPHVVQSEARLKPVKSKKKGKGKTVEVEMGYLPCEYYKYMVASLSFIMPKAAEEEASALLLGLGGGTLAGFLSSQFPKLKLNVVELDPAVVSVARDWYLPPTCSMNVTVEDALITIRRCASEGRTFDLVLVDVDSKDLAQGLTCPPGEFLELDVLECLSKIVSSSGVVVINFVCRNVALKEDVYKKLRCHFKSVRAKRIPEEVNEILYLSQCDRFESEAAAQNVQKLNRVMRTSSEDNDISDLLEGLQVL